MRTKTRFSHSLAAAFLNRGHNVFHEKTKGVDQQRQQCQSSRLAPQRLDCNNETQCEVRLSDIRDANQNKTEH